MILDDSESYRVDGVCVDVPSNSHFHYDIFLPTVGLEELENSIYYIVKEPSLHDNCYFVVPSSKFFRYYLI